LRFPVFEKAQFVTALGIARMRNDQPYFSPESLGQYTATGWAQLTDQFGITSEKTLIQAGEQYDIETLTLEK